MALPTLNCELHKEAQHKFFPSREPHMTNIGSWGPFALPETAKTVDGLLTGQEGDPNGQVNNKTLWKWNQTVGQERDAKSSELRNTAKQHEAWLIKSPMGSGESRIIFLPERSSIYQYRPEISAIIVKKQSRTRLLFAHPLLYILITQKMSCAF